MADVRCQIWRIVLTLALVAELAVLRISALDEIFFTKILEMGVFLVICTDSLGMAILAVQIIVVPIGSLLRGATGFALL